MQAPRVNFVWGAMIGCLFALALMWTAVLPASAQEDAAKLYKQRCESCHAADGKGNTPAGRATGARDFRSREVQKQTEAQLIEITSKGKHGMPGYEKKLTEKQIQDLVAYIRTMGKKK